MGGASTRASVRRAGRAQEQRKLNEREILGEGGLGVSVGEREREREREREMDRELGGRERELSARNRG